MTSPDDRLTTSISYRERKMQAWVNGVLLDDPSQPALSTLDHGVTVGDGVFETVKVVSNQPFALTRHLERLDRSANGLGLPVPDRARILDAIKLVLAQQDYPLGGSG